ncbi:MAG: class I SAM-dependent methyltransferase, partial [Mesorhizobium sp.]
MSNDDPFTLDLFGNTSLSSGLGLGVTAFGSDFGAEDHADERPSPPAGPEPHAKPAPRAAGHGRDPAVTARGQSFFLESDRGLAKGWKQRARDNLAAIRLAAEIETEDRPATPEEQARLVRFTGFGASDLANAVFRRPGETAFRDGWDEIGAELEDAVSGQDYASLARCTQYAHFTPEFIVRAMWSGLQRLGWRGGRVLEPGIGTGLL